MPTDVVRTYLQMTSPDEHRRGEQRHFPSTRIERVDACPASFFRYLYSEVGRAHRWVDRLMWTEDQIRDHLSQPGLSLWVLHDHGAPAGYVELLKCEDGSVEIAYFGLLPEFHGKGLGRHLLNFAIHTAWESGATRVWLHTCSLDHPAAVPNYINRGFKPYKQETYQVP